MAIGKLNAEQRQAVTHGEGPVLIVAGAGTGKTTVITERVAWLIEQKKAKADEILALTFTDKAAGEMEERIDKLLPYGYVDLWVMTFHSFCERILKNHALDIGLPNEFKLLNQTQQWMLVKKNLDRFNLDYYRPLGNPTKFIHALLKHFSRCKDEAIWPEDYLAYAEKLKINLDSMESTGGRGKGSKSPLPISKKSQSLKTRVDAKILGDDLDGTEIKRLEEVADAYHIYQQLLLENEALDFGDLINYTLKLFRERPKILEIYRQKFKYILVDEFQDTNWAQYELIKLLAAPKNNLMVVGDDDQCLPGGALIDMANGKQKRIDKIKRNDKVVSAVGKGHLGVCKVNKVFKNVKRARLLTIKTKSGKEIQVTDNHKMFCYVPKRSKSKYYYVYLMYRQNLGWRMGITNDIAVRLKLERTADTILAIKAFKTEAEARYYETLWSLRYGIPTVCFQERDKVIIKDKWLKKLYQDIEVEKNVKRLARDLNIDLDSYHYYLGAVTRGQSKRVLIHFEMCYRPYRSKAHVKSKKDLMLNNLVRHQLAVDSSNKKIINKLKQAGYKLSKSKQGQRLRITNVDIKKVGAEALKLQRLTGGFIVYKFKVAKINYQTLPAVIMPAKNLVLGHYLPVRKGSEVVYDEIISIKSREVKQTVYDLEIDRTHNFIANGVAVHNSIYKFRGASVSNILQFKDDYAQSADIYLTKNYRSKQNILDRAYNFIQLNNPERLEVKLLAKNNGRTGLSKKLVAQQKGEGRVEHLHAESENQEAKTVVNKIIELYNQAAKNKQASWNDFAILVRANRQAEAFLSALRQAGVPFNFVAAKGLYNKEIIRDILAYLNLLDNYHESVAMWRILNLDQLKISLEDLMEITRFSQRKAYSLYETISQPGLLKNISQATRDKLNYLVAKIKAHSQLAQKDVRQAVLAFLEDFKYSQYLIEQNNERAFIYLKQFFKKIDDFEKDNEERGVSNFMELINLELAGGEEGDLPKEVEEGPEAVKVMTVHAAKGLEFKYVFIVNLVDKRFPSIERREPIELPDELIKEKIPSGDVHLQEERRLFYVAMTRAKDGLWLTSADNYGGKTRKKLSRFLYELGLEKQTAGKNTPAQTAELADIITGQSPKAKVQKTEKKAYALPQAFSYSQLKAFETCPYQYYLAFILKVPVKGKDVFSYGKTMHNTLQKFMQRLKQASGLGQAELFAVGSGGQPSAAELKKALPSLDELLQLYKASWIDDWYKSKAEKEKYYQLGKETLKGFYQQIKAAPPQVLELEKGFNFKLGKYTIKGVIDRVDKLANGKVEIIDYKTGSPKTEKTLKDKDQLLIYQLAAQEVFGWQVEKLTFHYLNDNSQVSFLGTDKELTKLKEKMLNLIEQIQQMDWTATPGQFNCRYCDFAGICEYSKN